MIWEDGTILWMLRWGADIVAREVHVSGVALTGSRHTSMLSKILADERQKSATGHCVSKRPR